jgi:hypothetical protein
MIEELYSFDKYKGFCIYINDDNGMFYGDIYNNGTCYEANIKSITADKCLDKCKNKIDAIINYEGGAE